jgi:transcriptional regulator with XRE-family HTH domain
MADVLVAPRYHGLPWVSAARATQVRLPNEPMSRFTSEYGGRVNLARRRAGLSQSELGEALGLSRSSVANVEAGRQGSSAEQVVQFAKALGVPAAWLLVGDSTWTPPPARLTREQMRQVAAQLKDCSAQLRDCARTLTKAAGPPRRSTPSVQFEHPDQKIHPPWDDRTVAALNAFQAAEAMHPFTCPRDHVTAGDMKLVATSDGWVCCGAPACGYTQGWAHAFMATDLA